MKVLRLLRSKLTRRIVILGLSLILILASFSQINQKTRLAEKAGQMAGEVAGVFISNKFLDNTILQSISTNEVSAQVTSPYQNVEGNVSISGLVGIGTISPTGKLGISGGNIIFEEDTTERFIAPRTYGGAIRFKGNAVTSADRSLQLGVMDNNDVFTPIMTIDTNNSSVGIGTASPQRLLDIIASSGSEVTNLRLSNSAWNANQLNTLEFFSGVVGSSNLVTSAIKSKLYGGGTSGELQFWTNNGGLTQQMTILNNGYVGIGTASPNARLTIYDSGTLDPSTTGLKNLTFGDIAESNGWRAIGMCGGGVGTGPISCFATNSGWWYWGTQTNDTTMNTTMSLDNSGNLTIYGPLASKPGGGSWASTSDSRLKRNIRPITNALDKILKLKGVNFEWINPEEHGNMTGAQGGFIAQEVEKIFPNWITEIDPSGKDKGLVGTNEKIGSLTLPFEYDALIVEAIKEQQAQIKALQAENAALRSKVDSLEERLKALEEKTR